MNTEHDRMSADFQRGVSNFVARHVEGHIGGFMDDIKTLFECVDMASNITTPGRALHEEMPYDHDEIFDWFTPASDPQDDDYIEVADNNAYCWQADGEYFYHFDDPDCILDEDDEATIEDYSDIERHQTQAESARFFVDEEGYEHEVNEAAEENGSNGEIFSHYAVSDFLAHQLSQRGEKVVKINGWQCWGRTTFGQCISMDGVICDIYQVEQWDDDKARAELIAKAQAFIDDNTGWCAQRESVSIIDQPLRLAR